MPGVHDVSVVGLPDDRLGETVAAFVVAARGWATADDERDDDDGNKSGGDGDKTADAAGTLTKAAVRDWVRARLAAHLVPKHVFWLPDLPKTASGKIQKFKLREAAAADGDNGR
ncbi:hypothetical protein CDD83_10749 [Cordyceps sp. RAO-2017]|nr:hypothetical protein CDD83_10749 [Cordyceps sp. RAO-2017]